METRVCSQCGQAKPLSDYPGRNRKCRACRNEYNRLRKRRIKEGKGIPLPTNNVDDIVEKINRQGWDIPLHIAKRKKREYLLMDTRITKIQASRGRDWPPPPCRECLPKVLAYCAETGAECKKFLSWVGTD